MQKKNAERSDDNSNSNKSRHFIGILANKLFYCAVQTKHKRKSVTYFFKIRIKQENNSYPAWLGLLHLNSQVELLK